MSTHGKLKNSCIPCPESKMPRLWESLTKNTGKLVGAFVILEKGADLIEADIRDYAIGKIARYKVPKHIFIVDEIPSDSKW